jgi:hypothetical protein
MPSGSQQRMGRAALRTYASQVSMQQQIIMRLIPIAGPFMFAFCAAGATPMVAILAGLAVGLLIGTLWLLPKGFTIDEHTQRGVALASGGMLLIACGVQALVWRLGLNSHAAGILLIQCMIALACVFLLVDGARATLRWAWKLTQK